MASPSQKANGIPSGQQQPSAAWGEYNKIIFAVQQALGKMQTATLVKVVAVTNAGALSPVGFVDVVPLVNQLDGAGNPTPHATIYNLPYLRMQGGTDAIIMDPKVGDIGPAVFASRDISKVKSTKDRANPGSLRQYSFSDGMYMGGMLNGTPEQYIQFSAAGVKIFSPTKITLEAPDIQLTAQTVEVNATVSTTVTTPTFTVNGATVLNGGFSQGGGVAHFNSDVHSDGTISADVDMTAAGTSAHTHRHTSTTAGTPTSTPIP